MEVAIVLSVFSAIVGIYYILNQQREIERGKVENMIVSNILDKMAKEILIMRKEGEMSIADATQKHAGIQQILFNNEELLRRNENVLKRNTMELYNVKDCTMWLWDRYNNMIDLMDKRADLLQQFPDTVALKARIMSDRAEVEKYYQNIFKMTPAQAKTIAQTVSGKTADGKELMGSASIN